MPKPTLEMISPPAARIPEIEMPKNSTIAEPSSRKVDRMAKA
jgi:hypothetical protein